MLPAAMPASAEPPRAPRFGGWPLVGILPTIARVGLIELYTRLWREHGDTFRVRLGPRDVLCTVHPDALEHILVGNRENYVKEGTYKLLRVLTGDGLLTLEGEPWRRSRRMAQPAFHKESIRALVASMSTVTREWIDELERRLPSGSVIEAHHEMLKLTLDIVGETLFGQRLGAGADASSAAFTAAMEVLSERGNVPVQLPMSIPTPSNLRLKRSLALLDTMVYRVIGDGRARPPERATLLSMLIGARDADTGEALADAELRNEVITLVLAGHETTALLLTWGFTLLGRHPEVVARMRHEVETVLSGREPTAEDLPKLVYLRQVIDEILRLRSPVWSLGRDVAGDDVLGGFRVHKGEVVTPIVYLTHRHPAFWEDPERFDPDRFSPERSRGRHHYQYVPFSAGPRMCIGNLFTLYEAQIILAQLLQRCDFEMATHKPVPLKPLMTLRPGGPVPVRLRFRKR